MYGKQIVNHIGALGSRVRGYFELGRASKAAKAIDSLDPASIDLSEVPPEVALEGNFCANCGDQLEGLYCAVCGQRDRDMQRPVWFLFADVGDEIFSWDSRVFQTLGPLLFLPGALTRSFWDGKRSRFVPPIRLYLICSLFFFLVVAVADVAILKFTLVPVSKDKADAAQVLEAKKKQPKSCARRVWPCRRNWRCPNRMWSAKIPLIPRPRGWRSGYKDQGRVRRN